MEAGVGPQNNNAGFAPELVEFKVSDGPSFGRCRSIDELDCEAIACEARPVLNRARYRLRLVNGKCQDEEERKLEWRR